jgi:NADPH2:quinone reductase
VGAEAERRGVRVTGIDDRMSADEARRQTAAALALLAAGELSPIVGQVVPLERAAQAHAAMEARSVPGKTLLVTGSGAAA